MTKICTKGSFTVTCAVSGINALLSAFLATNASVMTGEKQVKFWEFRGLVKNRV